MTGINHVLTGGIIGAAVASPAVFPVALASHYLLDMLPHYGVEHDSEHATDKVWRIDFVLIAAFIIYAIVAGLNDQPWILVGAAVAMVPDLAWVYRFAIHERFGARPARKKNLLNRVHANIQKHESSDRLWIEAAMLMLLTIIFGNIVG